MQLTVNMDPVIRLRWLVPLALLGLTVGEAGAQAVPKASYIAQRSFQLPAKGQPGAPDRPSAVAQGPDRTVHVADGRGLVFVYDSAGIYRRSYGTGQLRRPVALAVDRKGEAYVLDGARGQVIVFGPGGQPLRAIGSKGTRSGQFANPIDLALGPSGHVYVLDQARKAVQLFSRDGLFVRDVRPGDILKQPVAFAVGNDGSIYFVDGRTPTQILVLPPFTKLPWAGAAPRGVGARIALRGSITEPVAIAVNDYGTVLVLDKRGGGLWGRNRWKQDQVGRNDLLYGGIGTGRGSFQEPVDVALNGRTEVLVLDSRLRKVEQFRLTTEGELTARPDLGFPIRVSRGAAPLPAPLYAIGYAPDGTPRFLMSAQSRGLRLTGSTAQIRTTVYGDSVRAFLPSPEVLKAHLSRQLGEVAAAAINDTMVVVVERRRNRFVIFGLDGMPKGAFGHNYRDDRKLKSPNGVAILPNGRIVICDTGNNRVKIYSSDLTSLVGNYTFPDVFGVAVSPSGEILAWSEDGTSVGRLVSGTRFTPIQPGLLPGAVAGLAFDRANNLFVLDRKTHRVTIIEAGLDRLLTQFGTHGGVSRSSWIFVDADANIYIADPRAGRTFVYRWDIAFPPPSNMRVAYERGAVVLRWAAGPERYVQGYQLQRATDAAGPYYGIAVTKEPSFRVDSTLVGESQTRFVRVAPIYTSGVAGRASEAFPVLNLTGAAAYERGDYPAAIDDARQALLLIKDGVLEADNGSRGELLWIGFASAYRLGDFAGAVKWGEQVGGWAPPERRIEFPFKMAQTYLRIGNPRGAAEQVLTSAGQSPRPEYFRDPAVIALSFRVHDALRDAGLEGEAVDFLRFYARALPSTVSDVKRAYEDSITVRRTRDKLAPGFEYWRNANYGDAMRFFEDLLLTDELNTEQQVLARQILAAGYYAFGRQSEAEDVFREIYKIKPNFNLRSEIERLQRLYGLTVYNPETQRYFTALRPGP